MNLSLRDALVLKAHHCGGQIPLAERLGCGQATVSRLIRGDVALSAVMAERIVREFPELRALVEREMQAANTPITTPAQVA